MSLLTRIRVRMRTGAGATRTTVRTTVGNALLVHGADGPTEDARTLAESLPVDPGHELVVADLPPDAPAEVWESFVAALPKGRNPMRLVLGRHPREVGPRLGQWLADRTGRVVLAPYGLMHQGVAGALFVHSVASSCWVRFRRGQMAVRESKRFPRPAWESPAVAEVRPVGADGSVAEPLPAGMWIRPGGVDDLFVGSRTRLVRALPCQPGVPVIVVGSPGAPALELGAVKAFWQTLPADIKSEAWFTRFGEVALPDGASLGQTLANVLKQEVRCYTGIPVGAPDAPAVVALRADGTHGWNTFAQGFAYRPQGTDAQPGPRRLRAHRPPAPQLREVSPGVYECAPDIVVEVVEAGLWVRSAEEPAAAAVVRAAELDPVRNHVLYEAVDPQQAQRVRAAAESLVGRIDYQTKLVTTLMPVTTPPSPAPPSTESPTAALPTVEPEESGMKPITAESATTALRKAEPSGVEPPLPELPLLSRMMETMAMRAPEFPSLPTEGTGR
ncbi:hypothetical protein ALI144C_07860 [Actinosynnema sp. ALI-1.44]|uniref:hypothetical protein n=1 Tax=Actinosynnema sp. ALI-1.44 TaxID=1933779 RepID=UPI00097BBC7C|nr:hypothetical protein [Actinosynnema sp. ALI-1.44]ONI87849.1 hypothetical protein ALI144C_07860 [Actinosynnema sp. ALI-1.44]